MFKNILVPVNFAKGNKKAVEIAGKIAADNNGAVHLLHVIEIIADTTFEEFKDFYINLEVRAKRRMTSLISTRTAGEIEITPAILFGNPVEEIMAYARKHRIELIVMNSHKIDLDHPFEGWGTISYKIGILAQCPVMLVK